MRLQLVLPLGAVAVAVALAGTAAATSPGHAPAPAAGSLRLVGHAPDLLCPGPETRTVPPGADPVDPGAPVAVSAAAWSSSRRALAELRRLGAPVSAGSAGHGAEEDAAGDDGAAQDGAAHDGTAQDGAAQKGSAGNGTVTLAGSAPTAGDPGSAGLAATSLTKAGGVVLRAHTAVDGSAPLTAALQVTAAPAGDLRGLAVRQCAPAATDAWLVGGATSQGRRARLLLVNPTPAPAVVDVTVHGADGPVEAPAGEGVVVAGESEIALLLDALAPGRPRLAVHVVARSGRVAATLHDSLLRGLVPGGVDDVAPAAAPARVQVVPGVVVAASRARSGARPELPDDPAAPGAVAVRVAVPGPEDAVVRLRLLGPDGPEELPGGVVTVRGGGVADIPVTGIPDGGYGVEVRADVPVVAGAVVGRTSPGGQRAGDAAVSRGVPASELGWTAATGPLGEGLLALPTPAAGGEATLAAASPGGGSLEVRFLDAEGGVTTTRTMTVPEGGAASLAVPASARAALVRRLTGHVHAALVLEQATGSTPLFGIAPLDPAATSAPARRAAVADPRVGMRPEPRQDR